MKVVFAAIRYPPAPGGAETHVRALAEGLAARGHEVTVHASDLFTEYPFVRRELPSEVDGVRVVRHRARRLAGAWTVMPTLPRALRGEAYDVLHAHSYGYHQTVVAARDATRRKKPLVFTPHFHPPWSMEGGALRRALRAAYDPTLGRYALRAASRVVAVSTGELAEMRRHLPVQDEKVRVIPNGFHAARFRPPPDGEAFRAKLGLDAGAPLVVYAGRLASNKGLPHLVDAMPRFDATVALAGEDQGWGPRLMEQARRLGVADRLRIVGHLDDATYRSALAAADALALPSEWEAFGIVLAEAMACGTPAVATRVGGAPDVVEDGKTGLLVPYGDAAALGDALARLLTDAPLRRRMGDAGRERAFRLFTWDAVVERTLALYGEIG